VFPADQALVRMTALMMWGRTLILRKRTLVSSVLRHSVVLRLKSKAHPAFSMAITQGEEAALSLPPKRRGSLKGTLRKGRRSRQISTSSPETQEI
jgi:hypothetical protein